MQPRNAMISPAQCLKPVDIKRDNIIIKYLNPVCCSGTKSKTCIDCQANPKYTISMACLGDSIRT